MQLIKQAKLIAKPNFAIPLIVRAIKKAAALIDSNTSVLQNNNTVVSLLLKERMNYMLMSLGIIGFIIAVFGFNPWATRNKSASVLSDTFTSLETGTERKANGIYEVRALTRMPNVTAEMVRWWFADYLQTTEQYKKWNPKAHVWMDWENKVPGEVIGASHLVHEYTGTTLQKLRIQFVEPKEILDDYEPKDDRFVICARAGLLDKPLNVTHMCHIVENTEYGAQMRSAFWMGYVEKRDGNKQVASIEGLLGNTALARMLLISKQDSIDLMSHAIEEMNVLASFLPELYEQEVIAKQKTTVK
ncbi:hypothetical protein L2735_03195 [Shewanella olleyana]|uniref:DAPG hydrolase family protein n=1 Tax=Shewanella olleyana TaxID=135626 RepID=UPI00200E5EED|nr:hypothetical protein [Shewanella olleyana]MCL1065811.1 hypothetical protein [Shewanella olleyana]